MYLNNIVARKISLAITSSILILMPTANVCADIPKATVLFSVPYYATNSPNDIFTPVAHSKGRTYLVWVDTANRPWVSMHFNGNVTTAPLDSNADYTSFPDGHHRFSMGVDKKGYLHVTGDMHNYPSGPDGNNYLPARYQNQKILYWISNQPNTVAGGFHFAGGTKDVTAIEGTGFMLGRFIHDKNGELYYSTMARAYDNGTFLKGMGALAFYHYNIDSHTWTPLGGYANNQATNPPGTKYYKVLFWEDAGLAPDGWFQNYQANLKFDNQNRLHLAVSANVDATMSLNSRVLYANSIDGGKTWHRANGIAIPGLPLRGVDSSPNVADVVIDTKGVTGLPVYADVVADQAGNPIVLADIWRRWNGSAWVTDANNSQKVNGTRGMLGPDGKMTFLQTDTIYLRRSKEFLENSSAYQLQQLLPNNTLHYFQCISDLGLQSTGSLYGVATDDGETNPANNTLLVTKLDFVTNALPAPWSDTDIGSAIVYGGSGDFDGNHVMLRASGSGIATNADNLHYTYQSLTGDGTIIARIATQDNIRAWATAGVMMRESLNQNASLAMMGVSSGSGTQLIYRNGTNSTALATVLGVNPSPQWVKLTRVGNLFTGYYSTDGLTWIQAGLPQTILMANTIYIGLTTWAFADLIHTATMDNIRIS